MTLAPIVIEDLLKFRYPSGLMYNPSGSVLALTVAEADEVKNGYKRNVWLVKDDKAVQLTASLSASAVLWDDEDHLILTRSTENAAAGKTELFRMSIKGGEAQPWNVLPFAMGNLKKVKDGLYIASGIIDANDPDAYLDSEETYKEKQEAKKKDADYTVIDEIPYWRNGKGVTNKKRTALFRVETCEGLKVTRITAPFEDCSEYVIDGEKVYFTSLTWERCFAKTNDLFVYNTADGTIEEIYNGHDRSISNLFVKNGVLYAQVTDMKTYGSNETGDFVKVEKSGFTFVMDPDRSMHNGAATDTTMGGGKSAAVVGNELVSLACDVDHIAVWKFDENFNKTVLFDQPGFITCMDAKNDQIAVVYSDPTHLCEVYVMKMDGSDCHQVTSLNEHVLEGKYVADPVEMTYEFEGMELNGWVLLPDNFDPEKKYPGVLDIHGGPRAIYTAGYFHEMQVWAARGYMVFFTNIRGSDGRGDEFADIRDQFGFVDYDNLMVFTDAVLAKYPCLDEKRLCVTGGSYGGYMTNWIVGHTDRFCAIASQRSISNWMSKILISDIGLWYNAEQQGAQNIFRDTEALWRHSPLKYAEGAKTPTLFIHSDEDYRCPLPEGMQMMQALAYQNVETRMCIFHGENHELSRGGKPTHRIRRLSEISDWFDKFAK